MADVDLKGVVVPNDQVAGFIRKHGPPSYSKPHGADKNILYYPDTEAAKAAAEEEFVDFAGTETPATRDLVIQGATGRSQLSSREIRSGGVGKVLPATVGNPNRAAENAEILNEDALDDEILDLEEEHRDAILNPPKDGEPNPLGPRTPPSLSDKVRKVEQDPINETVDVELPTDSSMVSTAEPRRIEPNVPEGKRAAGDQGKKSTRKAAKKGGAKKGRNR